MQQSPWEAERRLVRTGSIGLQRTVINLLCRNHQDNWGNRLIVGWVRVRILVKYLVPFELQVLPSNWEARVSIYSLLTAYMQQSPLREADNSFRLVKMFSAFYEPDDTVTRSQEPAIWLHPMSVECTTPILLPGDLFEMLLLHLLFPRPPFPSN
jgi:hypothetical protein